MKFIVLPANEQRRLSFYLAMEEYVSRQLDEPDAFFFWQVAPSVIYGRNQVVENEVNLDYCREHGIEMFRRKSGGGCVYADRGNIMMSYIARGEDVEFIFHRYTEQVATMLCGLGLDAKASERNDVLVGGRKVSGNALYRTAGHCIVHGTMLFDTQMEHMLGALTPPNEKLAGKGGECEEKTAYGGEFHGALLGGCWDGC
jgi:lipoyltransferase/lipoate-protein ligase